MFDQAQFMEGKNQKDGDRMVGAGGKNHELDFAKNECEIPGREKQHDPMIMKWCYRASLPIMKSRCRTPQASSDDGDDEPQQTL